MRRGFTLIEMIMAMAAAFIVMLTTAIIVHSGYRGWNQTYNNANRESRLGALDTMVSLGAIGRKSNKIDYRMYKLVGSSYQRATPLANPEEIVTGDAVEFRYWDTDLTADLMNPDVNATVFALFYLDNGRLKVNYGPYPPGGINPGGQRTAGVNITTTTLAKNVSSVEFSHTTKNMAGDGKGCVRMRLVITDPTDGSSKTTIAATLMRNVWPQ
jgi:prepilin-type N-terminal cleavage/methylation domain-containing protein